MNFEQASARLKSLDGPDENDDLFDEDGNEALEDFNRLTDLLFQRVSEFADEEDVDDDILPLLLLRLSVTMRMTGYAASVAKPSGGGLKLDLDRFRRAADELIRETKKDADRFIAQVRRRWRRRNWTRMRAEPAGSCCLPL